MKLAIGYSTKDQVEITEQTLPRIMSHAGTSWDLDIFWCDGSQTIDGKAFPEVYVERLNFFPGVGGGADAAIAWKLSTMLNAPQQYTHIGLLENDVLLDEDWFEPTMELFEKGKADGLHIGAVSGRSYVDRVLIQRQGYAIMHNIGAGAVVFSRAAAELVLRSFRTHWWPDNRRLFAQLSGIDLATYAAFKGNEQWVSTDWGWDAQLARHGLASLALTPAKCQMIGQKWPLEQQGLRLTSIDDDMFDPRDREFESYRNNLAATREFGWTYAQPGIIHRDDGMLFFPHQLGHLAGYEPWQGTLELQWNQGFGPFAYRAGPGGASLSVRISGSCSFLAAGGQVTIEDHRSGFKTSPDLSEAKELVSIQVPGGPIPRKITMQLAEGAVFYGLQTSDPQLLDTTFKFDWSQLPKAV
jgi:hypothetical protein